MKLRGQVYFIHWAALGRQTMKRTESAKLSTCEVRIPWLLSCSPRVLSGKLYSLALKRTNSMISRLRIEDVRMGTKRKTITITDNQDSWVKSQIDAGGFTNDSEYIRDLIRRDQASQADIEAIRAALIEGEESGEPQPFDVDQFKRAMTDKHG